MGSRFAGGLGFAARRPVRVDFSSALASGDGREVGDPVPFLDEVAELGLAAVPHHDPHLIGRKAEPIPKLAEGRARLGLQLEALPDTKLGRKTAQAGVEPHLNLQVGYPS
jgi:hypothetical protein